MTQLEKFTDTLSKGYTFKGDYIELGKGMLAGTPIPDAPVRVPLKTLNRHGLIAGATGTGKTKTLQIISELLSEKGIPVLMMDIKGDLSGIAAAAAENPKIRERHEKLQIPYEPAAYPVELLSLSAEPGARLRSTVSEFGPVLFSRMLNLSEVQAGIISVIFKYADDNSLPLLDLKDLRKLLQYATEEGKEELEREYGRISTTSTGAIMRNIVALEQQGADVFFGEPSFEVSDLLRLDEKGQGYINIVRLTDIQDKPHLFSTFMLGLLAEIYSTFPEQGDTGRPELVIFLDEAHLIFDQASPELLNQIENIVKLIRSKGVGLYFVTQNPTDVPDAVLSQLGLKIQHALRAFTAKDRKAIKLTAENYPISEFYKTDEVLTSLGIGEALVSALNEKGIPTPLAATMLRAPKSRMDILSPTEIEGLVAVSKLSKKYNKTIDRESAYEILNDKIARAEQYAREAQRQKETELKRQPTETFSRRRSASRSSAANPILKVLTSATFIRGVMGILTRAMRK
ncbi:MAG: helicase HerA-like domain-containing protein [Flavobacteriaceae bacterium]|nr:helicase HerA-like domain-containing protein [Flavobacteriaceae bacterium]